MDKEVIKVTKVKNEGRVAGGKRLAEWNRKNKENLRNNKDQVDASGGQVDVSESSRTSLCSNGWLGVGVLVLAGGIAAYIVVYRHCSKNQPASPPKTDDIFTMN